jgi:hypothetical protein
VTRPGVAAEETVAETASRARGITTEWFDAGALEILAELLA